MTPQKGAGVSVGAATPAVKSPRPTTTKARGTTPAGHSHTRRGTVHRNADVRSLHASAFAARTARRRYALWTVVGLGAVMGLYLAAAAIAAATDHSRIASLLVIVACLAAIPYLLIREASR